MSRLQSLTHEERTVIFYESPHRIVKTLEQFQQVFGADRQCAVCREISKVHEECVRGTVAQVLKHFSETEPKGEFVLILSGASECGNPVLLEQDNAENGDKVAEKPLSKYQRKMMNME